MEQRKIEHINYLAKKAKETALTEEEKKEQATLRAEYLADFRKQFTGILEHTVIEYPDGTKQPLSERKKHSK